MRESSGSAGIVQQLTASIESKAKAAAHSPRNGAQNSTKQKISVSVDIVMRVLIE